MKAIVQEAYGSPDVLKLQEIDRPEVTDDVVLVRVHAASLHAGDYFITKGAPFAVRMTTGLRKPSETHIPGFSVAGHVEAVGRNVTRFQPGDEVFGGCDRSCAEYACTGEDRLALRPANLTLEQAAAVPTLRTGCPTRSP